MNLLTSILINIVMIVSLLTMSGHSLAYEKGDSEDYVGMHFLKSISEGGSFLGVYLGEVDSEVVEELGLKEEYGAHVKKVIEGSPAEEAGLEKDDVIIRWNDERVESATQLQRLVRETPIGRKVHIGLMRDSKEQIVDVTLGKHSKHTYGSDFIEPLKKYKDSWKEYRKYIPKGIDRYIFDDDEGNIIIRGKGLDDLGKRIKKEILIFRGKGRMGVTLHSLTPQLADYFGLKDKEGVLIASVRKDSPAEKAGLEAGDIIISIDGEDIEDPHDAVEIVQEKEEGTLNVVVMRDKREKSFEVHLEKEEDIEEKCLESEKFIHSIRHKEKV